MPRGDGRRRLKELRRVLERVRTSGLGPTLQPIEAAAVMMFICDIVGQAPARGTSRRIVEALAVIHDRSNALSAAHHPDIACRRGCSHCCKTFVSAAPPQIFAIADYIRARPADPALALDRLTAAETATRGITLENRDGAGIACPFLFDEACAIYPVRPPACRSHMSVSVEKCIAAVHQKNAPDIPVPYFSVQHRTALDQALWGVLYKRGVPFVGLELGQAVMTVLPDPGAEDRWFRGEDVFAGVARDPTGMGGMPMATAALIWDSLWAIAHGDIPHKDAPFNHLLPLWCFT